MRNTRLFPAFAGGIIWACVVTSANGQITELTPNPTVTLSIASPAPAMNVSSMKIVSGDWTVKPVYEITGGGPKVRGLLATTSPGTVTGSNYSAVYYLRPEVDCGEWTAKAWTSDSAWDAVTKVKAMHVIADDQDPFWEIPPDASNAGAIEKEYAQGFAIDDPLGEVVNMLESQARREVVDLLKLGGYPVANVPFEKGEARETKGWLISAAQFFDEAIGQNLQGETLRVAVMNFYRPPLWPWDPTCELVERCVDVWNCLNPPRCRRETICGEWQPDGPACNCRTDGPWAAACGRFTADARGKITIHIPFPPPRGSDVEGSAGIGATVNMCVCVWQRTCEAASKRTVVTIAEDRTRTSSIEEGPVMMFSHYSTTTASSEGECQRAGRPADVPSGDRPCGLRNPTPDHP